MIAIDLTRAEIDLAYDLAHKSYERFAEHEGHYRNMRRSHLVGKLGEVAVDKYFSSLQPRRIVQPHYRDPDMEASCDLTFGQTRIEVKTWSDEYWAEWGRCVAVAQMDRVQRKADVIVWCSEQSTIQTVKILIHGWSTPDELARVPAKLTGPAGHRVLNHQLAVDELHNTEYLGVPV
jgi:hypothetical protein